MTAVFMHTVAQCMIALETHDSINYAQSHDRVINSIVTNLHNGEMLI